MYSEKIKQKIHDRMKKRCVAKNHINDILIVHDTLENFKEIWLNSLSGNKTFSLIFNFLISYNDSLEMLCPPIDNEWSSETSKYHAKNFMTFWGDDTIDLSQELKKVCRIPPKFNDDKEKLIKERDLAIESMNKLKIIFEKMIKEITLKNKTEKAT